MTYEPSNGDDVYVPNGPGSDHQCEPPDVRPRGSIWRCARCATYWYRVAMPDDPSVGDWRKVRWFHFGIHKKIKDLDGYW